MALQDHAVDETQTFTDRRDQISLGHVLFWESTYAEASLDIAGCRVYVTEVMTGAIRRSVKFRLTTCPIHLTVAVFSDNMFTFTQGNWRIYS